MPFKSERAREKARAFFCICVARTFLLGPLETHNLTYQYSTVALPTEDCLGACHIRPIVAT
jgi:hypothetical protein